MTRGEEIAERLLDCSRGIGLAAAPNPAPPTLPEEEHVIESRFVASHRGASRETLATQAPYGPSPIVPVAATQGSAPAPATSPTEGRQYLGPRIGPSPDQARQLRSALAPRVRRRLEALEADAAILLGTSRLASDRAAEAREELRQLRDRVTQVQGLPPEIAGRWIPDPASGPTARVWRPNPGEAPDELATAVADAEQELARLELARAEADRRWQVAARIVEAACVHLGVPGRR